MTRPQCVETTAKGERCRKPAMVGADRCAFHLGANRGGRPRLLSEDLAEKLVTMLRAGNYVGVAVRAAGISRAAFHEWMQRGLSERADDEPFRVLRERVERARAEGEVRNVAQIARAAMERWEAAAWMLERQYPERWGRVSVRLRGEAEEQPEPVIDDPFAEVDELAEKRRSRSAR